MNGNRFEFLELGGEDERPQVPAQEDPEEVALGGRDPIAERGAMGEPLAQVRDTDTRGYRSYLENTEEAAQGESLRNRLHHTPSRLRAAEVFGERGQQAGQFNAPTGLAVDRSGVLFVADSYNHRIQRITPDGGVSPLGSRGNGNGQFLSPQGIAIDANDSFYIVEQGNHRVQKYAADGTFLRVQGKLGSREGEFRGPTGIAVAPHSGDYYVADPGNARVQRFDMSGAFIMSISVPEPGPTSPFSPQAVAVDQDETVYISDPFWGRVWRYDSLGRPAGSLSLQFTYPRALACGRSGLLYVADAGEDTDADWTTLQYGGRIQALHGPKSRLLTTVEQASSRLGRLIRPGGVAVIPSTSQAMRSDIYVADTGNHRIIRFTWE